MQSGSVILSKSKMDITITRLCHQLIETHGDFENTCIIGVQSRGAILAEKIVHKLMLLGIPIKFFGKLDITFYRDDFRTGNMPLKASRTDIQFLVDQKKVVLVDDVLYTGRTTQAALSALQDFGRPQSVELLVLIDRRFNREFPVESDYTGTTVDSLNDAYVRVHWEHLEGEECVRLFDSKS